jgi:REP element-mobilizing transposase RayT
VTAPRQIIAGRTYLITRRCTQRQFLLLPTKVVEQIYLYCLGEAATRFNVTVHAWIVMSNHAHLIVRDNEGNLPEFLAHLHKLVAKALNAHWKRRENFWSNEQANVVHLVDAEDLFDKLVYVLTNPIAEGQVDRVVDWPGASSFRQNLSGAPRTMKRPSFFRAEGPMPDVVTLQPRKLDGFEHLSESAWSDKIAQAVRDAERLARATRKGRVLGRRAVLDARHTDAPKTEPADKELTPHIACKNPERRLAALRALRGFRAAHRHALERWRDGERGVAFPAGTYRMRIFARCRVDTAPGS